MGLIGISDGYGLMGIKLQIQAWYCWILWGRMLMGCFSGWVGYQILWGLKHIKTRYHGMPWDTWDIMMGDIGKNGGDSIYDQWLFK